MTTLPNTADSSVSTTPHLPARWPVGAAVLACAVYSLSLPPWLLLPWDRGFGSTGGWVVTLGIYATRIVVTVAFGSAALFGLMHLTNLVTGAHPISVSAQVLMAVGLGIGFGAVALATGTIWPLVVIHFFMDVNYSIQVAAPGQDTGTDMANLLLGAGISVLLGLLAAGYGLWLLRRRVGLLRELDTPASWPASGGRAS